MLFEGSLKDETIQGIKVRRYTPLSQVIGRALYFLHGGYGIFGDLNLQDNYCRLLATTTRRSVTSIDYPLTPEHTLTESAQAVANILRHDGAHNSIVCGDSAGGAVSLELCQSLGVRENHVGGLFLTNPNIDLTLALFDEKASAGPDIDLLRDAIDAWTRGLRSTPQFHKATSGLPATFIAVGTNDALVPEAEALTQACHATSVPCEIVLVKDAAHGFISDPSTARDVIHCAQTFFG